MITIKDIPQDLKDAVILGFVSEGVNPDSVGAAAMGVVYAQLKLDYVNATELTDNTVIEEFNKRPRVYAKLGLEIYREFLILQATMNPNLTREIVDLVDKATVKLIERTVKAFTTRFGMPDDQPEPGEQVQTTPFPTASNTETELDAMTSPATPNNKVWCDTCSTFHILPVD